MFLLLNSCDRLDLMVHFDEEHSAETVTLSNSYICFDFFTCAFSYFDLTSLISTDIMWSSFGSSTSWRSLRRFFLLTVSNALKVQGSNPALKVQILFYLTQIMPLVSIVSITEPPPKDPGFYIVSHVTRRSSPRPKPERVTFLLTMHRHIIHQNSSITKPRSSFVQQHIVREMGSRESICF